jgi:hypothetical protein
MGVLLVHTCHHFFHYGLENNKPQNVSLIWNQWKQVVHFILETLAILQLSIITTISCVRIWLMVVIPSKTQEWGV